MSEVQSEHAHPAAAGGADVDTGHDYDGIREYDNRLPNWWLATLFISIVFGYGYFFYYHVFDGGSLAATYAAEAAEAASHQAGPVDDVTILALAGSTLMQEKAAPLFQAQCVACHGPNGEGKIGPNLTDKFWIHGGKPTEIYNTISKGVVSKGMLAWGPILGDEKVRMMAAYITTLKGKNLPGKAPEGLESKD